MKLSNYRSPLSILLNTAAAAALFTAAISPIRADMLYWDANGSTSGAKTSPLGTWGSSNFWNTDSTGGGSGSFRTATTSLDDLFFSAGSDAVNSYTITLSGTQSANSLTFEDGIPKIQGGTQITLGAGGINTTTTSGATINSNINMTADQTWNVAGASSILNVAGTLSGGFNLTKNGGGILSLMNNANTLSAVTLAAGTLQVSNRLNAVNGADANGLGTATITLNGGMLDLRNNATSNFGNTVNVGGNATVNVDTASASGTPGRNMTLGDLSFTQSGAILTATNGNDYSLTFGNVTMAGDQNTLYAQTAAVTIADLQDTATTGNQTFTFQTDSAFDSVINGAITQSAGGQLALVKTGARNLALNGTGSNFTGGTQIQAGSLKLNQSNLLPLTGVVTLGTPGASGNSLSSIGGNLNLNNFSQTIGGLADAAFNNTNSNSVSSGSGSISTLTLANLAGSTNTFSGSIGTAANNNIKVVMNGPGTQILAGANPYTGGTTVNGGTLILANSNADNNTVSGAIIISGNGSNIASIGNGILQLAASNQVSDASTLTLAGGTFALNGYSETLGTLTLGGTSSDIHSIINFGGASGVLSFSDSSGSLGSGSLDIQGWNGLTTGSGSDQLIIKNLSASQLSQIQFINPNGMSGNYKAAQLSNGEIVQGDPISPTPEPSALLPIYIGFSWLGVLIARRRTASVKPTSAPTE